MMKANKKAITKKAAKKVTKVAKKTASMKTTKSKTNTAKYARVSDHIYTDGTSYRVRVMKNKVTKSVSCSSKTKAFQVRKALLAA